VRTAIGRAVLNYFGSKVSSAHKYPPPKHDTIIEPFAGGAGYSLCHWERKIQLYDINPDVVRAWQYVIRATPEEILALPLLQPGQRVDELDCGEDGRLLIGWCVGRRSASPNSKLAPCVEKCCQLHLATWWSHARRAQVANVAAHVKHWRAYDARYTDCPDDRATWFIDPPYIEAGRNYPFGSGGIDYQHLAEWCRSRPGQTIVCENEGADWLPFVPLIRGKRGSTMNDGKSRRRTEVIWCSDPDDMPGQLELFGT